MSGNFRLGAAFPSVVATPRDHPARRDLLPAMIV
jgi:hypothetical protein